MEKLKEFFGIEEKFRIEWNDISALLTIFNVTFILMGFWWAPILGIANSFISLIIYISNNAHINLYTMQLALIVLNIYFLM